MSMVSEDTVRQAYERCEKGILMRIECMREKRGERERE
jgi:hypothetical protein